jgi:hypothetical protein
VRGADAGAAAAAAGRSTGLGGAARKERGAWRPGESRNAC